MAASFMKMTMRMARQGAQGSSSLAEVYKLTPDGHEELVRGMEIAEITPASFKDIVAAAGDTPQRFLRRVHPPHRRGVFAGVAGSTEMPVVSCGAVPAV